MVTGEEASPPRCVVIHLVTASSKQLNDQRRPTWTCEPLPNRLSVGVPLPRRGAAYVGES